MIDKLIDLKDAFAEWFIGAVAIVTAGVIFVFMLSVAILLTPWPWLAIIAYIALV